MPHNGSNDNVTLQDIVDKFSIPLDLAKKVSKDALHKLYTGAKKKFTVVELGIEDLGLSQKRKILGSLPVTLKDGLETLKDLRDPKDPLTDVEWRFWRESNELVGKMRFWLQQDNPWNADLTKWFEPIRGAGGTVSLRVKGAASSVTQFGDFPLIVSHEFSQLKTWVDRIMNVLSKPRSFVNNAYTLVSSSKKSAKLTDLRNLKSWWNSIGEGFSIPQSLENRLSTNNGGNGDKLSPNFGGLDVSGSISRFFKTTKNVAGAVIPTSIQWFTPSSGSSTVGSGGSEPPIPGDGGNKKKIGILTLSLGVIVATIGDIWNQAIRFFSNLIIAPLTWLETQFTTIVEKVTGSLSIIDSTTTTISSIQGEFGPFGLIVSIAVVLLALYMARKAVKKIW